MSVSGGPDIVENGLVLCLDAGNTKSYPGSGTAWTDLSRRGNNGTLTNGPTFNSANGGSIVFDGSNDYVRCVGSTTVTAATFIVWMYRNGNQDSYDAFLFSRGTNSTGLNFFGATNRLGYHWNDTSTSYSWDSGLLVPDSEWCFCALSVTSTTAIMYLYQKSGLTSATNTISHATSVLDDVIVGWDEAAARYFNGRIAVAHIYNRALSQTEIIQNYNATKGRFRL